MNSSSKFQKHKFKFRTLSTKVVNDLFHAIAAMNHYWHSTDDK